MPEILALLSAVCVAFGGMLAAGTGGRLGVLRLSRWTMCTAFAMTGALSLALGGWRTVQPDSLLRLAGSSVFGVMLATLTFYGAIHRAGAALTALLFSLTSPFALLLGILVLGEGVTPAQAGGVAFVLAGVGLTIGPLSRGGDARVPWSGVAMGVATAGGQAIGNLLARPAMERGVEPFTAMAVRSGLGALFFAALALVPLAFVPRASPASAASRPRAADIARAVSSALVGTGLGMASLMAALAQGNIGMVSTLSSVTPVAILPMMWLHTGRPPRRAAWIGAVLTVGGVGLISLSGAG